MYKLVHFFINFCLDKTGMLHFAVLQRGSVGLISVLGLSTLGCDPRDLQGLA